jgi:hypothetical protein
MYENITKKLNKLRYINSKVTEKWYVREICLLPPCSPTIFGGKE